MDQAGTYDVVVVGGGIAGLVAGVRAAELGRSVLVLEKGATERYPCNARWSGGIFHLAYNDPKRPAPELIEATRQATGGRIDPDLAEVLAKGAPLLVDWLGKHGARFIRPGPAWQNWTLAPPRAIMAGIDWAGRGPDVLLRQLGSNLRRLGSELRLETRVTSLLMEEGRCVGVEALSAGQDRLFRARSVILCDGGFQSDLELVRRHISPAPEKVKQRGAATGCGDGLRMAEAAGVATTGLDRFYGHLLCRDAMHNDKVWPYPELDGIASAGILVDATGQRFVDEGRGGILMANAVAALPDPLSTTLVFDSAIWEGAGRSARIPANPLLVRAGGTVHQASSLADLARAASLPGAALEETVANYNRALGEAALDRLPCTRTTQRFPAYPIATAPFYAIPACAGITYTMGGVSSDSRARVLDRTGAPIPGLYAAGSILGGIEGGENAAYLGGLLKAGVFAMIAAEDAARVASGAALVSGAA